MTEAKEEFKVKDQVPEGAGVLKAEVKEKEDPTKNVCAIYDGSLSAGVMIHKLVKDGKMVTVLQNDRVKFEKLNLESKIIPSIGDYKDPKKILAYVKDCGKYCLEKGIIFLYIGWTTDKITTEIVEGEGDKQKSHGLVFQDLFTKDIPYALAEISDEAAKKFVRCMFYNYGKSDVEMEKNKTQYGL